LKRASSPYSTIYKIAVKRLFFLRTGQCRRQAQPNINTSCDIALNALKPSISFDPHRYRSSQKPIESQTTQAQHHIQTTEQQNLRSHNTSSRIDKLRQESKKEQRSLGIKQLHNPSLQKHARKRSWSRSIDLMLFFTSQQRSDAQIDQISCANILHNRKCQGRRQKERREPECCRRRMNKICRPDSQCRNHCRPPPLIHAPCNHIQNCRSRNKEQPYRCNEK